MNKTSLTSVPSSCRRRWFLQSAASLAGALGAGTVGNLALGMRQAHAADYKALVCIFLYGGNDGMNTIVPTETALYNEYADVRQALAIQRERLVSLTGIPYGLHPSLSALRAAWNSGALAPIFNVGTLNRPLTKAEFRAAPRTSTDIPENLFSHADQQTLWETGTTQSLSRTGWGGRASVELRTANPVISVSGSTRFGQSELQSALVLPTDPGALFGAHRLQPKDLGWTPLADRKATLDLMYSQRDETALGDAFSAAQRNAFVVSERLAGLVKITPKSEAANAVIDGAFAPLISSSHKLKTDLGKQLYQVAKLIHGSATVQGNRQIFFAQMDGFDTHGTQVITGSSSEGHHARLLQELGDALACFNAAMSNLGLGHAVTAFTQSDFGRTFVPNGSNGTDHGWGNHHLVLGGAIKGGASYGHYPDLALGGEQDIGQAKWEQQGRWLPTTSVDQYAATLLNWFGASDAQLARILPNLSHFNRPKMGFI